MSANCKGCGKSIALSGKAAHRNITYEICDTCAALASGSSDSNVLLESIDAPILLMQGNPRQVLTANKRALTLFGKTPSEIEGYRGGEVFDCVHSFTEAGCGKDVNCENCKIKNAIVDTFGTGNSHNGVSTGLSILKANCTRPYVLQISTEKIGDMALVRIERYDADA